MSKIVVLKVSDESLNEEEGLDVIRQVLAHLGLRASITQERNESRYWTIGSPNDQNRKDLAESLDELIPLVDEEAGGIIGYLIPEHAADIEDHLNGTEPKLETAPGNEPG